MRPRFGCGQKSGRESCYGRWPNAESAPSKAELVLLAEGRLISSCDLVRSRAEAFEVLEFSYIGVFIPVQQPPEIAPLFKADNATLSFYATKDGKISINYQGWDQSKTVLEGATVCD